MLNKTVLTTIMVAIMIILVGWIIYLFMRGGDSVPVQATFSGEKVVYTMDVGLAKEPFIEHCTDLGGTFNECGSPCAPDAEACIAVCAYTCELKKESSKPSSPDTFNLSVGETKGFDGLSITLHDIVADSRCPVDAVCVRQGEITVRTTLEAGGEKTVASFTSADGFSFEGYDISVIEAKPDNLAGKSIDDADYVITFLVKKQ